VRLHAALERGLAADLRKIFKRIGQNAARKVMEGNPHAAAAVVDQEHAALLKTLKARMLQAGIAFGRITLDDLSGKKGAEAAERKLVSLIEIAERALLRWLAAHAAERVVAILDGIRSSIRRSLVTSVEQNEAPRQAADRIIEQTDGEIGKSRAMRIARTEIHTASNVGSTESARATGLDLDKEWASTHDKRTRPAHEEADGQVVDQNDTFLVGDERLRFPGDPEGSAANIINCRCVLLWRPRIPE